MLRRVFEAVTQGRAREVADLVDPRMQFISVVAGRTFFGVKGLEEWYADVSSYYEQTDWQILAISDLGGGCAVRWRFAGRSRETGVEFATEMSQLWSFQGGRVVRVEVFPDADAAALAARQDPPP